MNLNIYEKITKRLFLVVPPYSIAKMCLSYYLAVALVVHSRARAPTLNICDWRATVTTPYATIVPF